MGWCATSIEHNLRYELHKELGSMLALKFALLLPLLPPFVGAVGVKHMIFFTQRWLPSFQTGHELIADGLIGRCFSCHFHFFAGYGGTLSGWRFDAQRGGGILGDIGAHSIDRVHWYLGDIVKVSASLKTFTDLAGGERNPDPANNAALLAFELANGAHGTICCNSVAHVGEQGQQNLMAIHGDQGSLEGQGHT